MLEDRMKDKLVLSKKRKSSEPGPREARPGTPSKHSRHEQEGQAHPRAQLSKLHKNPGSRHLRSLSTTRLRSGQAESYITDLDCSSDQLVAAALSDSAVKLLQVQPADLRLQSTLSGHSGFVSEVRFSKDSPQHVLSCGAGGKVLGWDTRTGEKTQRFAAEGEHHLNSFDLSGDTVAAGANGTVLFWDRRKESELLEHFADTHEQEVTQVRFHPEQPQTFLSASTDGLVSVFDFSSGIDENESFVAAINFMDSVAKMGFYGQQKQLLWCTTHTEALRLWEWAAACEEDSEGGAGPLAALEDARQQLISAATSQSDSEMEYLVGCSYDAATDQLRLAGGTSTGTAVVCPTTYKSTGKCKVKRPIAVLQGGHQSVIRSILWPELPDMACISGGEDGRVVVWAAQERVPAAEGTLQQRPRAKKQTTEGKDIG